MCESSSWKYVWVTLFSTILCFSSLKIYLGIGHWLPIPHSLPIPNIRTMSPYTYIYSNEFHMNWNATKYTKKTPTPIQHGTNDLLYTHYQKNILTLTSYVTTFRPYLVMMVVYCWLLLKIIGIDVVSTPYKNQNTLTTSTIIHEDVTMDVLQTNNLFTLLWGTPDQEQPHTLEDVKWCIHPLG